jgi:hypothetical protein
MTLMWLSPRLSTLQSTPFPDAEAFPNRRSRHKLTLTVYFRPVTPPMSDR